MLHSKLEELSFPNSVMCGMGAAIPSFSARLRSRPRQRWASLGKASSIVFSFNILYFLIYYFYLKKSDLKLIFLGKDIKMKNNSYLDKQNFG
jgi:energy-converting hydrogenase Eha subunit G